MNKYIILPVLIFLIILPVFAFSQSTQTIPASSSANGFFLDVAGCLSLPVGAYAMSDESNSRSGFGRLGPAAQVTCDWIGKKDFGLAFQYIFQLNPLEKNIKDSVLPGMSVALGAGDWTNHYIMAGPVFMKYFGKILFEAKALIGVVISSSPYFKTVDPAYNTVSNNTGTGFAAGISAGAGYAVSSVVTLKFNAGYLYGAPKIDRQYGAQIIGYRDSAFVYSPPVNFNTKKIVSAFNLGISAVFKLSK